MSEIKFVSVTEEELEPKLSYAEKQRIYELGFYKGLAEELKPNGYRCWLYDEDYSAWLYIVTPNNSLLYIDRGEYDGYDICFEWKPSKDFGTGCRCNEKSLYEITKETLDEAETYGRHYNIHSKRYNTYKYPKYFDNALDALKTRWCFNKLAEL